MTSAPRVAAFVCLVAALAACTAPNPGPAATPSPTARDSSSVAPASIAGENVHFVVDDFKGMIVEDDAPAGLTMDAFWLDSPVADEAPDTVAYFDPTAFDRPECAQHPMLLELVQPSDDASATDGSIMYWFEYGVVLGDSWTTAAIVSARLFATPAEASAYLQDGRDAIKTCAGGYSFTSDDGQVWTVASVSPGVRPDGYPDDVAVMESETAFAGQDLTTNSAFLQYGNVVVAIRLDESPAIVQPPSRLDDIGTMIANHLMERGDDG